MDKLMDSPWFLRLTALFLAIILFISVQTEEGNLKNKSVGDQMDIIHDVPVEVYYDDENLVVTGVPQTVNVTIEGPTNIVQTTKVMKDFTVFVDLRTLTMGQHHVKIQHENVSDKLTVRLDPATIDIQIEEKITETFRIEPELNRRLLAEDFTVEQLVAEPATVQVTGAKSIIDSISFVKATVSSEAGISKSFEQDARIRVLDRDLNKLNVEVRPETAKVKVDVIQNHKEVPIVLKQVGQPAEGKKVKSLTTEKQTMKIFGSPKALEEINELLVDVDVSKVTKSGPQTVEVKKPATLTKLADTKITVQVNLTEEDVGEEVAEKPEEPQMQQRVEQIPIVIKGIQPLFEATITNPEGGKVAITIKGDEQVLKQIRPSQFTATVDITGMDEEGEIERAIQVQGPNQVQWSLSTTQAVITLKQA